MIVAVEGIKKVLRNKWSLSKRTVWMIYHGFFVACVRYDENIETEKNGSKRVPKRVCFGNRALELVCKTGSLSF